MRLGSIYLVYFFYSTLPPPPSSTLFPYTTLFRSLVPVREFSEDQFLLFATKDGLVKKTVLSEFGNPRSVGIRAINIEKRSEEHTSELQSHSDLVCRLLLEKKKTTSRNPTPRRSYP